MKPRDWPILNDTDRRKWLQICVQNANKGVNPFLGMGTPGHLKPWGPQAAADPDYLPLDIIREMAEEDPMLWFHHEWAMLVQLLIEDRIAPIYRNGPCQAIDQWKEWCEGDANQIDAENGNGNGCIVQKA